MIFNRQRALDILRVGTGSKAAEFRDGQEAAIQHVVEGRGRLLVVQKTGWGKSFVYFIATKLLREDGKGPALLVSPLLALMRNQIEAAERMGVRAATINSDNQNEWEETEKKLRNDEIDILVISPERLANEHFRVSVLGEIATVISMVVIDEAHCISDWGRSWKFFEEVCIAPRFACRRYVCEVKQSVWLGWQSKWLRFRGTASYIH